MPYIRMSVRLRTGKFDIRKRDVELRQEEAQLLADEIRAVLLERMDQGYDSPRKPGSDATYDFKGYDGRPYTKTGNLREVISQSSSPHGEWKLTVREGYVSMKLRGEVAKYAKVVSGGGDFVGALNRVRTPRPENQWQKIYWMRGGTFSVVNAHMSSDEGFYMPERPLFPEHKPFTRSERKRIIGTVTKRVRERFRKR